MFPAPETPPRERERERERGRGIGISITRSSSAPPPLDPNPSIDINKKKKKKKKRLLSDIGSSYDQDQNLSIGHKSPISKSRFEISVSRSNLSSISRSPTFCSCYSQLRSEPKGEKLDLLANRINISISPKLRTLTATRVEPEKRAMRGRRRDPGGGEGFVIAPKASLSTTAEETNPAPICPFCYEDMDVMDVSFCSCKCGFKLCLFYYNNIIQRGDDRCPRCRVSYRFSL